MTKAKPSANPVRHLPQRTCIGCRKTSFKREFVRLVSIPEVGVEIDLTGKKSGRGAYLCPARICWESALKSGKLEQALRIRLKPENKEKLVNHAQGFNNTSDGV